MTNHPNRGRYTTEEIRQYLTARYDAEQVKNGIEAADEDAGIYSGEECSWLVFGKIPNANQEGWFFAGYVGDIVREMRQDGK